MSDVQRSDYERIIEGGSGDTSEKRLASQFIAHFFKHFANVPDVAERALNALMDLCEATDAVVRSCSLAFVALLVFYTCLYPFTFTQPLPTSLNVFVFHHLLNTCNAK